MKKLLILVFIVELAISANAALMLSFNDDTDVRETTVAPSDYFVIGVYQDIDTSDEFWVNFTGGFSYSGYGTVYIPPAPTTLIANDGGYGYPWIHAYMSPDPATDGLIGKWWDVELHCESQDDVVVQLYDPSGYVIIDTLTIHQVVPEPLTVSLLGLGGLLLRRRKK